jgi:type II secretory pathway pseudopilin PulG
MRALRGRGVYPSSTPRARATPIARIIARRHRGSEEGFTLVELLIVTVVSPLIVGALAIGLVSILSLQTSTAARLSDTGDSQILEASFQPDVQSALAVTTENTTAYPGTVQCGSGFQILGLEWTPTSSGGYQTVVSYVEKSNGSTNGSVNLVRQYCTNGNTATVASSSILSYDLPQSPTSPFITLSCSTADPTCSTDATSKWVLTSGITNIVFSTTEPRSKYQFTLDAFPEASSSQDASGTPITPSSTTSCGFATPGSGKYSGSLCFVDFSTLIGTSMTAATVALPGCLEMSVQLPDGYFLYFCINISGTAVKPWPLPTWTLGFLGNQGVPADGSNPAIPANYTNIPGDPALYQTGSGTTTITLTDITIDSPQGVPATGWKFMSADAESTDTGESIVWSDATATNPANLHVVPNGTSIDTAADPIGNACLDDQLDQGLIGNKTPTVSCLANLPAENGNPAESETGAYKSGTAMVEALAPKTMTVTMVGTGLEAVCFGVFI